jgi:hypothetical protein
MTARSRVAPDALVLLTMALSLVFAFVIVWARECP